MPIERPSIENEPKHLHPFELAKGLLNFGAEALEDGTEWHSVLWSAGHLRENEQNREAIANNQKKIDAINKDLAPLFPQLPKEKSNIAEMSGEERNLSRLLQYTTYERGRELFLLGSIFESSPLEDISLENLERIFLDKKILILGDDIGSLSAVLRKLGAEAYGLEYNPEKVGVARAGTYAPNGLPQEQVILGDIGNIILDENKLMDLLINKGPFDALISRAVFNIGSGIEKLEGNLRIQKLLRERSQSIGATYLEQSDKLLKENGFQFHMDSDFMLTASYDGLFTGVIKDIKTIEQQGAITDIRDNYIQFHADQSKATGNDVLVKKGFVEALSRYNNPKLIR